MNLLLPAPLLIPLFCAILSLLARKSVGTQRFVSMASIKRGYRSYRLGVGQRLMGSVWSSTG